MEDQTQDNLDNLDEIEPEKVIISRGMADTQEITNALHCFTHIAHVTLMHCVSSYPMERKDANFSVIHSLRHTFGSMTDEIGYSDHSKGVLVPSLAVLAGATTIEKHFTLDYGGPGADNPVSANPTDMKTLVGFIKEWEEILGDGQIKMLDVEKAATVFRRKS